MGTTLLPAEMSRRWERFGQALVGSGRIEDLGTPRFAFVHDTRILKLFDESFLSSTSVVKNHDKFSLASKDLLIIGVT